MADMHRYAFIPVANYDPESITLSNYPVNSCIQSDNGNDYQTLEWIGPTYYSELKTWSRFNNNNSAAQFLEDN